MLTAIREKFTGGIAIGILALIGVPFLFFGVNFDRTGQSIVASVDGSDISAFTFEQAYRERLERNPTWAQAPSEFKQQVRAGVLNSMIRDRVVEMHLIREGYQISATQLDAVIQRVPEFQLDGVFDLDTAEMLLLQNGLTSEQFRASQRGRMRADQLRRAIGGTALVTPAAYRRYLNLIAEQRLVSLATFTLESVIAEVEVTDEMVVAFYDANDTLFLTQETADIEFIEVRRDAIAAGIEVSEEDLLFYYDDSSARYLQDEQRQARHILILSGDDAAAAETLAEDLLARARAGESFAALAQEYSKDGGTAANGGDLGVLTRSQLAGDLGGAIFDMVEGEVTGPIESEFGFHIVQLDKILERGPLPLDEVRAELLSELRDRDAESVFRDLERQVSDALFDGDDMQAIAAAVGLDVQAIAAFSRSGAEPFGANQAAIDAVFDASVLFDGNISEVIELDANRSVIFKVTQHNEATRLPLAEVRDQIVDDIKTQEASKIVFNRAEALYAALEAGEEFGVAAEAAGAVVSAPTLVSRQTQDIDRAVLGQIFMTTKPAPDASVTGQVTSIDGGVTVFSLDAVLPGRPESIPLVDRDSRREQLALEAGASDYYAFIQALYDNADIVISQDALAAQDLLQ